MKYFRMTTANNKPIERKVADRVLQTIARATA